MPFMLAITNDQLAMLMEVVSHMISCTYVILLLNQVKNLVTYVLKWLQVQFLLTGCFRDTNDVLCECGQYKSCISLPYLACPKISRF